MKIIIEELGLDSVYENVVQNWILQMGGLDTNNNHYYIRYAGICKWPTTPIDRLTEDLKERKNDFISYFFQENR